MKYLIKVSQVDQDMAYWRHALAELVTNIIPPQEHEFYEKVDYRKGITAIFFFKVPEGDYPDLFNKLKNLVQDCQNKIRITLVEFGHSVDFVSLDKER